MQIKSLKNWKGITGPWWSRGLECQSNGTLVMLKVEGSNPGLIVYFSQNRLQSLDKNGSIVRDCNRSPSISIDCRESRSILRNFDFWSRCMIAYGRSTQHWTDFPNLERWKLCMYRLCRRRFCETHLEDKTRLPSSEDGTYFTLV